MAVRGLMHPALGRVASSLIALALLASAGNSVTPSVPRGHFWDGWTDLSDLAQRAPDSALTIVERRLALDSLDVSALLLRARTLGADTLVAESLLARAGLDSTGVAANVVRGTLLFGRGRSAAGRAAWARARRGYLAMARPAEAARAAIHEALLDRTARDPSDPAILAAESLAAAIPDADLMLTARTLAGTRWLQRDAPRALKELRLATALIVTTGPCYMAAEAERQLALTHKTLGALDSARTHYERAVELARGLDRPELYARCMHSLGTIAEAQARLPEAERIYRDALALTPEDEYQQRANVLGQIGKLYQTLKRYDEASELFARSNALYDAHAPRAEGRVLNLQHLGQIATLNGDFDQAREQLERALADARAFGLPRLQGGILSDLSALSLEAGDPARATTQLDEALAWERKLGRERYVGNLLCTRAEILLDLDRPEAALANGREAAARLATAEPAGMPLAYGVSVRALLTLRRYGEAAVLADSSRAFAELRGDSALLLEASMLDAEVDLADGHPARALERLERTLPPARRLGARDLVTRLLERYGEALLATIHPERAALAFEEALRAQELSQYTLRSSDERSRVQTVWQELYVQLATAYLRAGRARDAFGVIDRSRARGLRETLARELPSPRLGVNPALLREVERTRATLEDAQRQLTAQYALEPANRSAGLPGLQTRCARLRERLTDAELRLERAAPAYARSSGLARSLDVAAVRRRLAPDEALLAYLTGRERSLVFVLTPASIVGGEIALGETALQRSVDSLTATLGRGGDDAWLAPARQLAEAIVPPSALGGRGRLFVAPDGPLHLLPFEVLRVGVGDSERCLIERRAIVMGASPSLLFGAPHASRAASPTLAAFGDPVIAAAAANTARRGGERDMGFAVGPLPNARREAEGIAARFAGARVYVGAQATEGRVLQELERCQVLHVAAHAFVDARHPRFSGLVLARDPERGSDGLLQAWEVLARRGDLDLVTLSACETGRGALQRGEGLLGLARAFRIAGARNLVVSLWQVDDAATAEFMLAFYDRLAAGQAPAEALAGVKRAMLAGGAPPLESASARGVTRVAAPRLRQHPAYWAAFVLQGEAGASPRATTPAPAKR